MSLLRWLLLTLVVSGVLAFAPMGSSSVATAKSTYLLLWVKLWRHVVLRGNRYGVIAPLLICSPASAPRFLLAFSHLASVGSLS